MRKRRQHKALSKRRKRVLENLRREALRPSFQEDSVEQDTASDNGESLNADEYRKNEAETTALVHNILSNWLEKTREETTKNGKGKGRKNKDVLSSLTSPIRVGQLESGWIELYDPKSKNFYYHNPVTDIVTWDFPSKTCQGEAMFESIEDIEDKSFRMKRFKFLWLVRGGEQFESRATSRICVRRDRILEDAFASFINLSTRGELKNKLLVTFDDEVGIGKGVTKEFYLTLCKTLLNPNFALFKPTSAKGHTVYEFSTALSALEDASIREEYFEFAGKVAAKCIYDGHAADLPLANFIFKSIIQYDEGSKGFAAIPEFELKDLSDVDSELQSSLEWIQDNTVENVLFNTFTTTVTDCGVTKEIELVPGGKLIEISNSNKKHYIYEMLQHRLHRQCLADGIISPRLLL